MDFKRAHVNDFSESGNTGPWEEQDWPEWTSMVGVTQVTPTYFTLESDTDPSPDYDPYLVVA